MDRTGIRTDLGDALDGVLVLHKEAGWTSHDVVAKVRSLLRGGKVGHAGTLDPSATGVLPILVGRATRIAEYLIDWDKEYHAVMRLGETTDTQDATGQVLSRGRSRCDHGGHASDSDHPIPRSAAAIATNVFSCESRRTAAV